MDFSNKNALDITEFEIGERLGSGRYGNVYLAIYKNPKFLCALKVIKKDELYRMNSVILLKREIEIQSRLRHKNILRLFGHFYDERNIYLVMEYASKGNLYKELKRRLYFSDKDSATYIHSLVKAINYMHSKNIIHRDLKPENLLIDHEGTLKLADFGWSVHTLKNRKSTCGTLDYLSPEMICKKDYKESVDIWAIGVLAYELIVGKPPFENEDTVKQYENIRSVNFKFPENISVSEEAKSFINGCLKEKPENRITIKDMLIHRWFKKFDLVTE